VSPVAGATRATACRARCAWAATGVLATFIITFFACVANSLWREGVPATTVGLTQDWIQAVKAGATPMRATDRGDEEATGFSTTPALTTRTLDAFELEAMGLGGGTGHHVRQSDIFPDSDVANGNLGWLRGTTTLTTLKATSTVMAATTVVGHGEPAAVSTKFTTITATSVATTTVAGPGGGRSSTTDATTTTTVATKLKATLMATTTATEAANATKLHYDCAVGFKRWEKNWLPPKRRWCCQHAGRGCELRETVIHSPPHNCSSGLSQEEESWTDSQRAFCCRTAGRGCHSTTAVLFHNCSSELSRSEKARCCQHNRTGCQTSTLTMTTHTTTTLTTSTTATFTSTTSTTIFLPYHCDANVDFEAWSLSKRGWCCEKRRLGCEASQPVLSTDTLGKAGTIGRSVPYYNCRAGLDRWELLWPAGKKRWCCSHKRQGCDPYDCGFGKQGAWRTAKRSFCCRTKHLGCSSPFSTVTLTTTTLYYDCDADVGRWRQAWSSLKQQYCCSHGGRGCRFSPYDCNAGISGWAYESWSAPKKEWCCSHGGLGCEPYDCTFQYGLWHPAKRRWCCSKKGLGCPPDFFTSTSSLPYDCSAGFHNHKIAWSVQKTAYCCTSHSSSVHSRIDCGKL